MTDTPDDLAARLLDRALDIQLARPMPANRPTSLLLKQAASRIEALESQELALKAAMEPLVEALELDFGASDDDSESLNGHSMRSTFGQLRRARAALAGDA